VSGQTVFIRSSFRTTLLNAYDPYSFNAVPPLPMFFTASNNLFYFDRNGAESFYVQGGCTYAGEAYTAYQQWTSNLYWRTDGAFGTDPQAFHVQQSLDASGNCGNQKLWTYYNIAGWRALGEDVQSVARIPGSIIRLIRRTITRCPRGRPVWDSLYLIPLKPAGRIP
jgi:hypothetical protein